ncbi:uncharacterized protein LOC108907551 [Anoplophora glabripennis]|uniref:uncharacterized protein LOC108907551 n=1 Tax=Anoplophora glabripennis TaxID=217634 RepID=UPI0008757F9F|nr:uncharacterized protein LOC108907551 [Anoplophora glabripennis]
MKVLVLSVFAVHILGSHSLIIPDELPSILSVIYSNIPTIKKGTDSRIGWGFRLGNRADFQVLVELGPQTNTQPLANQGDGNRKRNALNNLANTLYAQRQKDKRIKEEEEKRIKEQENLTTNDESEETIPSDNDGAKWLKSWSKSVNKNKQKDTLAFRPKPGLGVGEIDAKSVIPEDTVLLDQEKRKKQQEKPTTTAKEGALDSVNLE